MANDVSTIQSLKAVDAWIDVINANINGGVRTAFKASRLRFAGSNTQLDRAPTTSSLPLQLPEPGLITANTVIDWSQGAITSSTENTHLAIQGEGFFVLAHPDMMNANGTVNDPTTVTNRKVLVTRDGEFHTNQNGVLVHSSGYLLVTWQGVTGSELYWSTASSGAGSYFRCVYDDLSTKQPATVATQAIRLSDFLLNESKINRLLADGVTTAGVTIACTMAITGKQNLQYSTFGSTVYDFGFVHNGLGGVNNHAGGGLGFTLESGANRPHQAQLLAKSLEASNSSMTQSVPELSLAQKLFSALTKVLQIGQTNTDSVLNLVR